MSDVVLQVLLTPTDDGVQAHCLHMDIVTEAATTEQAISDIMDLIRAQYKYGRDTNNLEAVFVPAPPEYWRKLAHARSVGETQITFEGESEHTESPTVYTLQELELVGA
jgi:hypothetical protein